VPSNDLKAENDSITDGACRPGREAAPDDSRGAVRHSPSMSRDPDPDDEILIEMNRIGGSMEVRAISAIDGLEVAFTAPASALKMDIERLARAKLGYVRRKASGQGGDGGPKKPGGRRGLIA